MAYDPSGGNWKDVNRSVWQSAKWMKGSVKEDCKYYQVTGKVENWNY